MAIRTCVCGVLLAATAIGCGGGGGGGGTTGLFSFQPASLAIGQPGFTTGDFNRGAASAAANSLGQPTAASSDGNHVVIADWGNNRVLGFVGAPQTTDPTADFVVGQPDFASRGAGLSANRLNSPRGVCVDQGRLYVADSSNNRVLIWNSVPLADQTADRVLGQPNFTSNGAGAGAGGMNHPSAVFAVGGRLIVADSNNHRVLVWNTLPAANGAPADVVVGQPDFASTAAATTQTGLSAPASLWSDGVHLVVGDTSNYRVMIWNAFPTVNGQPADVVVGQTDFVSNVLKSGPDGFDYIGGVASDGARLFVCDGGHNRVLVFSPFPTQNGASASVVLGQSDFTHTAQNDDDQDGLGDATPTARTLYSPDQPLYAGGRLYVPDFHNSRVVVYAAP